jgi:hypothetical protein
MVSRAGASGMAPARLTLPQVGLMEHTPQAAAGKRNEPPVSEPRPAGMAPYATAAAVPAEEPPVIRVGSQGLRA